MNRNSQAHFATTPTVNVGRSKFDRSFTHKTTFNAGDIIPFYVDTNITPGDTVKMNTAHVVRMMTPITPVMDNAVLDTYFFFVPNRLIWDHWKAFMGENETAPWTQTIEYEIPQISAPASTGWTKGSLADYMGFPTGITGYKASALPFRAYALICTEWFRDENLKNPLYISKGDSDVTGVDITSATLDPVTDIECGACCFKAAKNFDYFTGCLPEPQKGPAVMIPIGDKAPVSFEPTDTPYYVTYPSVPDSVSGTPARFGIVGQSATFAYKDTSELLSANAASVALMTDLSQAVGATVTALRQAFQLQKFYEKQALYGSRYIEMVKGHFGVTNPDFRVQRPEYLGGVRTPININQVVQTDATSQQLGGSYVEGTWTWEMSDLSPQGNTAAYSLTSGRNKDLFTHSFTEHGILMGLAVVRLQNHTYQQGLNRQFMQKKFYDFYFPEFANLSNQPVYNKEIYCQDDSVVDSGGNIVNDQAFGYQEAWAHYRYMPDIVTGEMRSNYAQSLDIWHWADNYNSLPSLGSDWIDEDKSNIARTLAVQSHDQFFGDFFFNAVYTRPMPLYSIPGLIDHH